MNNNNNRHGNRGNSGNNNHQGRGSNSGSGPKVAVAPYNFVPLPEKINYVEQGTNSDKDAEKRFSGVIDVRAETLSPVFIRGPVTKDPNGTWQASPDARLRSEPFMDASGKPVIPGSSFRGMIRSIAEIISFSKISPVSEQKLFYRDLPDKDYRGNFVDVDGKMIQGGFHHSTNQQVNNRAPYYEYYVKAGFLKKTGRDWAIEECDYGRIDHSLLRSIGSIYEFDKNNRPASPNWKLQNKEVFISADPTPRYYFFPKRETRPRNDWEKPRLIHPDFYLRYIKIQSASLNTGGDCRKKATLVITGPMPNKHLEFCFWKKENHATINVPEEFLERFNDEDQITQKQQDFFPKNNPTSNCRREKGWLRDGEPVFFINDEKGGLKFFGRAMLFRLPYPCSPAELVSPDQRSDRIDFAESLFGTVERSGSSPKAIRGRVSFSDLVGETGYKIGDEQIPGILASPKPTTYQHYLEQSGDRATQKYRPGSKLRGHKLYWHRQVEPGVSSKSRIEALRNHPQNDTQHTIIRPVEKAVFRGSVRFSDLTREELGCLLHALRLPKGCAHKVGMAKPRGFGSIRLDIISPDNKSDLSGKIIISDPESAYASWQGSSVKIVEIKDFCEAFEKHITGFCQRCMPGQFDEGKSGLLKIKRLVELFRLLDHKNKPDNAKTRYMVIENGDRGLFGDNNEFKRRYLLPRPLAVK